MNKSFFYSCCLILATFFCNSCVKNSELDNGEDAISVSFSIEPIGADINDVPTKTYMSAGDPKWSAGDRVGIYPETGGQVYFDVEDFDVSQVQFDGGGWAFKSNIMYVSYYPVVPEFYLDRENVPVSYLGQTQDGKQMSSNTTPILLGKYDYMCTPYVGVSDGSLLFHYFRAGFFWRFNISNLPAGEYTQLTVTVPEAVLVTEGHLNLNADPNYVVIADKTSDSMSITLNNITVSSQSDPAFYVFMMAAPVDLSGQNVVVSLINAEKKQFDCKKTISRAYDRNQFYGLTCNSWEEVPQTIGIGITEWTSGDQISGKAN